MSPPKSDPDRLDHEKLDVYQVATQYFTVAMSLLPSKGEKVLHDQLSRSVSSIVLNIAEGAGRHSRPDKRRFYEMAKGSATESAAILDILRLRGIGPVERHAQARVLIVRVVKMLSRLCGAAGRE